MPGRIVESSAYVVQKDSFFRIFLIFLLSRKEIHTMFRFLIAVVVFCTAGFAQQQVTILSVQKADVFLAELQDKTKIVIHLAGTAAPGIEEPIGAMARQYVLDLIMNTTVTYTPVPIEYHQYNVGRISLNNGTDLGLKLVESGFAWHFHPIGGDSLLAAAEREAIDQRIGVWESATPVLPREIAGLIASEKHLHDGSTEPLLQEESNTGTKLNKAVQCKGMTKDLKRCTRMTTNESGYCWQHERH